ncbi:NAPDH-dependent diflavin reductase [Puccinia graminis f. sp. tritici]|uniref:NAPDH-dependent diflavin reductase n=1 Tax=Puccinia graminis f. sp. tritici TaxID=56615 RepID=A0A5B0N0D3_PUCGR|nr:NAPDH-dependent diflavin reductase [Puccinia graminis f. sp. tritici]
MVSGFILSPLSFRFQPGSVAEILPENCAEDVEKLFKLMKWTDLSDQVYRLSYYDSIQQDLPVGWTEYATLREIFTSRLDFMAVPGRSFIDWLSHFTSDPMETERLQEFCSIEGQDDLFEYTKRPRRTILEVLSEFKSATIPLDYIHDVFPQIRPRQFSIASSPKENKRYVQDLIVENSALVWEYMAVRNASIFISGSAGEMPKGVRSALKNVCVGQGGLDQTGADEFIERLEVLGKLQEDTWS